MSQNTAAVDALIRAWEPLARQLTIVIGLSTSLHGTLGDVVEEHRVLLDALKHGTPEQLEEVMEAHILEVPDAELGTVPMHNIHPYLSATPGPFRSPAPSLGEHTDDVLAEAGYTNEEITTLRRGAVIY